VPITPNTGLRGPCVEADWPVERYQITAASPDYQTQLQRQSREPVALGFLVKLGPEACFLDAGSAHRFAQLFALDEGMDLSKRRKPMED
jgi:hypothetical protein